MSIFGSMQDGGKKCGKLQLAALCAEFLFLN
jgi:hypothetical protein